MFLYFVPNDIRQYPPKFSFYLQEGGRRHKGEKTMKSPTGQLYCDFCGKGEEACDHLIASDSFGPGCAICSKCVLECTQILIDSVGKAERRLLGRPATLGAE